MLAIDDLLYYTQGKGLDDRTPPPSDIDPRAYPDYFHKLSFYNIFFISNLYHRSEKLPLKNRTPLYKHRSEKDMVWKIRVNNVHQVEGWRGMSIH